VITSFRSFPFLSSCEFLAQKAQPPEKYQKDDEATSASRQCSTHHGDNSMGPRGGRLRGSQDKKLWPKISWGKKMHVLDKTFVCRFKVQLPWAHCVSRDIFHYFIIQNLSTLRQLKF